MLLVYHLQPQDQSFNLCLVPQACNLQKKQLRMEAIDLQVGLMDLSQQQPSMVFLRRYSTASQDLPFDRNRDSTKSTAFPEADAWKVGIEA